MNMITTDIQVFGASQKNTEQVYCHVSVESDAVRSKVFETNNPI